MSSVVSQLLDSSDTLEPVDREILGNIKIFTVSLNQYLSSFKILDSRLSLPPRGWCGGICILYCRSELNLWQWFNSPPYLGYFFHPIDVIDFAEGYGLKLPPLIWSDIFLDSHKRQCCAWRCLHDVCGIWGGSRQLLQWQIPPQHTILRLWVNPPISELLNGSPLSPLPSSSLLSKSS